LGPKLFVGDNARCLALSWNRKNDNHANIIVSNMSKKTKKKTIVSK